MYLTSKSLMILATLTKANEEKERRSQELAEAGMKATFAAPSTVLPPRSKSVSAAPPPGGPSVNEAACGGRRPQVLANTAVELEASALAFVTDKVDMICIGPMLEEASEGNLIKAVDGYTEWLEKPAERSVVYVSFGSITLLRREQVEEIWRGLRESGRPYLWVIRKDSRWEGMELEEGKGMVVEWCSQERVLAHRAVGCFVTHCGWNSTVESLIYGVPTVAVQQWLDQPTSAWLMEKAWGTGLKVEDGLLKAEELRRCVEVVTGGGRGGDDEWGPYVEGEGSCGCRTRRVVGLEYENVS